MEHGLDIRLPIGGLFIVLGAVLAGYGLSGYDAAAPALAIDITWGAVMVAFGVAMLAGARRGGRRRQAPSAPEPEDPLQDQANALVEEV